MELFATDEEISATGFGARVCNRIWTEASDTMEVEGFLDIVVNCQGFTFQVSKEFLSLLFRIEFALVETRFNLPRHPVRIAQFRDIDGRTFAR